MVAKLKIGALGFFKGFKKGAAIFGECITALINSALLTAVYAFGVGITSILAKVSGKRFLDRHPDKKKTTYWSDWAGTGMQANGNNGNKTKDTYYRQF